MHLQKDKPHRVFRKRLRRLALRAGIYGFIALSVLFPISAGAAPPADITVQTDQAVLDFPNTITFKIQASSSAEIQRIVLEYGVDQLTCGEVVAKAFPDFTPNTQVAGEWTWDMRQSGSEPPGARFWWQWRITDASGGEKLTERREIIWLDSIHSWQSLNDGLATVHWYAGGQSFGEEMLAASTRALLRVQNLTGLKPDKNIDLYLYGDYNDLRDAILFEPGWTGGMSYGEKNIILLGIPAGDEEWGKGAIAHELMHTVVDRNTFSCLISIPSWLHEGLAMVSEGGLGSYGMSELQAAIDDDTIFRVRSLTGGFPEDPDMAALAYDQSFSVVDFLLKQGDATRIRSLLTELSNGKPQDDALSDLYGFNVDGLDGAWRESVGAQPLLQEALEPTPTATIVPTFRPASNEPGIVSTSVKTPAAGKATPTGESGQVAQQPPYQTILLVVCGCLICLGLLAVAGVTVAMVIARRKQ